MHTYSIGKERDCEDLDGKIRRVECIDRMYMYTIEREKRRERERERNRTRIEERLE